MNSESTLWLAIGLLFLSTIIRAIEVRSLKQRIEILEASNATMIWHANRKGQK